MDKQIDRQMVVQTDSWKSRLKNRQTIDKWTDRCGLLCRQIDEWIDRLKNRHIDGCCETDIRMDGLIDRWIAV